MELVSKFYANFTTHNEITGANQNADSLPSAVLYKNGILNDMVLTVTAIATGVYSAVSVAPFSADGNWLPGDHFVCLVTATVNGVTETAPIANGEIDSLNAYLQKMIEADIIVETVDGHYEKVWFEKGTNTVLLRKEMRLLNGEYAVNAQHPVGQFIEPVGI
jgi:hypothetical protein